MSRHEDPAPVGGKTYRQIGDGLFISVNTVGFHVKQIGPNGVLVAPVAVAQRVTRQPR